MIHAKKAGLAGRFDPIARRSPSFTVAFASSCLGVVEMTKITQDESQRWGKKVCVRERRGKRNLTEIKELVEAASSRPGCVE